MANSALLQAFMDRVWSAGDVDAVDDLRRRRRSRHGSSVDFDLRDIHPSTGAVTTARHQVGESDFVHLAQVQLLQKIPRRDDPGNVELHSAHIGRSELADDPVARRGAVGAVADQPGAVAIANPPRQGSATFTLDSRRGSSNAYAYLVF